ncbi:MAG: sporulation protein YabP [Ruminococcaceae bacterium]|nr:sporulation protein YabP [Oscillospiraceae bacterium]
MNTVKDGQIHDISLNMRKHMDITGVRDVVSFDEQSVILTTVCGEMTVEGRDIKIGVLDTDRGIVSLDGKVDAVFYSNSDENKRQGLFGKLLK